MADIIRVAAQSHAAAVAGAIAGILREEQCAIVQAIGAAAVNQAIKATAVARSYIKDDGLELYMFPEFTTIEYCGGERTVTRLVVYTQHYDLHGEILGS